MELRKVCDIGGIFIYSDPNLEDNMIYKGRKRNSCHFIIASPKTANLLYQESIEYKRKERRKKLRKINEK